MKIKNLKLLKKISETPGTSGFEKEIRNLIISEIDDLSDSYRIDNMGNLTIFKKGKKNKKIMVAAHIDEIGFIITHIDDDGFLRFTTLGGFDPKTVVSHRVTIHGKKDITGVIGAKPIHLMSAEERGKKVDIKDFFIDTGLSKEEVEKYIEIGSPVTRQSELIEMGNCINGKSMDNRISVFILIETLKELKNKEIPFDLYAVFTVQEELGIRGAIPATLEIQPDFSFALDTTIAYDTPGASAHENITKLGEGTAIKIMDAGVVCDTRMVRYMKKTANRNKIKYQVEIFKGGGTDAAHMQKMVKNGSITGAVSTPTRYIHQVIESVHKSDIKESIKLLKSCILEIEDFNYDY